MDDIELYRSAKFFVDQHGDQAALQAAMQADALLGGGKQNRSAAGDVKASLA